MSFLKPPHPAKTSSRGTRVGRAWGRPPEASEGRFKATQTGRTTYSRWTSPDRVLGRASTGSAWDPTAPADEFQPAPQTRGKAVKAPPLAAQAVDAVLDLVADRPGASRSDAAAKLRQSVHRDAALRPRHAAVALTIADGLICSGSPASVQQKEAVRRAALTLLEPYISTSDERAVLTTLARAGIDTMPPLDEGPLKAAFHD
jgi:hypothetical protein